MNALKNRTIALAGVFQAAYLVAELAQSGKNEQPDAVAASIDSLFETDPKNLQAVYGRFSRLKLGLSQLKLFFSKQNSTQFTHVLRYAFNLLVLARKLQKNPQYSKTIGLHIQRAEIQAKHFEKMHDNILANFSQAYVETFGQLGRRIQILGDKHYLQNKHIVNKIRSLLLAGVRSGVLWQQNGGRMRQLLFFKGRIAKAADQLMQEHCYS